MQNRSLIRFEERSLSRREIGSQKPDPLPVGEAQQTYQPFPVSSQALLTVFVR